MPAAQQLGPQHSPCGLGNWLPDARSILHTPAGPLHPNLAGLPLLTALALADNQLTGSFPTAFGAAPLLAQLDLARNRLAGLLPLGSQLPPKISELRLDGNRFSGGWVGRRGCGWCACA